MDANYDRSWLFSVEGLVVVITGGGSGLGEYIAHALDCNGAAAVFILGRRLEQLQRVAAAAKNGTIRPITADVTSKESLQEAVSMIHAQIGYVNVVLANAGMTGPSVASLFTADPPASLAKTQETLWAPSMEDFTQTMHTNVTGAFYTAVAFLDLLNEGNRRQIVSQSSQIIFTSSAGAFSRVPAAGFAYAASKAAVVHLTKQLTTCFAPFKIRVNCITPGLYPSEMTAGAAWMREGDPRLDGAFPRSVIPVQRSGTEEDIAGLALFMMSRAGAYINGAVNLTDGGRLAVVPASY